MIHLIVFGYGNGSMDNDVVKNNLTNLDYIGDNDVITRGWRLKIKRRFILARGGPEILILIR